TEGPYFVDERLNRSNIRTDPATNIAKPGLPLTLGFNVGNVNNGSCEAVAGVYVDVWHCDALGVYSDVSDASFNTTGQKFLRGYQLPDSTGSVQFQTIYPGWYSGRAVHIHFKIRQFAGSQKTYECTSQLYFDDSITDEVHSKAPYSAKGPRDTRNSRDGIFSNGGSQLLLDLTQSDQGYAATFDIGLEGIASTPASPEVTGAAVNGKSLIVMGRDFDTGATLSMNGETQNKTGNDPSNPTTALISRKAAKKISPGQTVSLQVTNADGAVSNQFLFTRPLA